MMRNTKAIPREPTELEIQHVDYLLWIEAGCPEGQAFDHWIAAMETLCDRKGGDSKTPRRAPGIASNALTSAGAN